MNQILAPAPIKWTRVWAGNYGATIRRAGKVFDLRIREYVKGDWELTINGRHASYGGTKRACQAHAERLVAEAVAQ